MPPGVQLLLSAHNSGIRRLLAHGATYPVMSAYFVLSAVAIASCSCNWIRCEVFRDARLPIC
jgi:hypothetical protein